MKGQIAMRQEEIAALEKLVESFFIEGEWSATPYTGQLIHKDEKITIIRSSRTNAENYYIGFDDPENDNEYCTIELNYKTAPTKIFAAISGMFTKFVDTKLQKEKEDRANKVIGIINKTFATS